MKKLILLFLIPLFSGGLKAQTYNAAYVKALYAKYPAVKSNLCQACKLWVNPYYKSIADTQRHMPVITYEHYTKAPKYMAGRTGIFAAWHSVSGQANEDGVYTAANKVGKGEIAKGHCQAWVLNSFSNDAAILSDTYTFNAGPEYQGQNVGTEIASEVHCRDLLKTQDIDVWCATFGNSGMFTDGKVTDVLPAYYWKVIKYGNTIECYWMPNLPTEGRGLLLQRTLTYQQLVKNLGFDPMKIFPPKT